ncbi:hypothetical protein GTA08_BOTSDO14156 [Botryosphaeria dothidea]|uniref:Zn(2)-C6 fungal-type domain-containing protein n=1 Tax=Botryosphaeria dothidea TaxID=55169 RepID=A0A8H4N4X7_9PEZI|nr:hypothetical protein GTA08_BOTSDO14156 [Botryosphaeria dothidea]
MPRHQRTEATHNDANGSQTAELGAGQPAAEPEPEDPYDDEAVKYKLKWVIDEEARKTCLTCRLRKRRCDQERPDATAARARVSFAYPTQSWLAAYGLSGNKLFLVSKDSKPNSVEDTSDSVKCGASEAAMKTEPSALQLPDEEGSGNDAEDAAAACVKQMKLTSSDDGGEYCIICNNGEDVSEEKGLECEGGACSDASVRRRSPILAEMEGEWTWVGWSSG